MSCHHATERHPKSENRKANAQRHWPKHRKGESGAEFRERVKAHFGVVDLFDQVEADVSAASADFLGARSFPYGVWFWEGPRERSHDVRR